jgi:hypothetical protein
MASKTKFHFFLNRRIKNKKPIFLSLKQFFLKKLFFEGKKLFCASEEHFVSNF